MRVINDIMEDNSVFNKDLARELQVLMEDYIRDAVEEQVTLTSVATHIFAGCCANAEHDLEIKIPEVIEIARDLIDSCS